MNLPLGFLSTLVAATLWIPNITIPELFWELSRMPGVFWERGERLCVSEEEGWLLVEISHEMPLLGADRWAEPSYFYVFRIFKVQLINFGFTVDSISSPHDNVIKTAVIPLLLV